MKTLDINETDYEEYKKIYTRQYTDLTYEIKDELNLLNGLIGAKDIANEFKRIVVKYPQTIKTIPILIAKRDSEIKVNSAEKNFCEALFELKIYKMHNFPQFIYTAHRKNRLLFLLKYVKKYCIILENKLFINGS